MVNVGQPPDGEIKVNPAVAAPPPPAKPKTVLPEYQNLSTADEQSVNNKPLAMAIGLRSEETDIFQYRVDGSGDPPSTTRLLVGSCPVEQVNIISELDDAEAEKYPLTRVNLSIRRATLKPDETFKTVLIDARPIPELKAAMVYNAEKQNNVGYRGLEVVCPREADHAVTLVLDKDGNFVDWKADEETQKRYEAEINSKHEAMLAVSTAADKPTIARSHVLEAVGLSAQTFTTQCVDIANTVRNFARDPKPQITQPSKENIVMPKLAFKLKV